ncbi:peptide chain release factor 1-like, mitochondrial [Aplysia californica]|uniref:Peptide chain release factor 1-like, mitochondrial n=1 Tax=Aplysia californica TaxID=6500 RepID=A0ABM0JKS1_APLCA|nr:peptide chain release factor 1-like, mitochondrial [Aplysia californica]
MSALFIRQQLLMHSVRSNTVCARHSEIQFLPKQLLLRYHHMLSSSRPGSNCQNMMTFSWCTSLKRKGICSSKHTSAFNVGPQIQNNAICFKTIDNSVQPYSMLMNSGRCYHSDSKFTMANSDFSSYVQSLVEEFNSITSSTIALDNKAVDKQVYHRLQFLEPVVAIAEVLKEKYEELQELTNLLKDEVDKEMMSLIEKDMDILREDIEETEFKMVNALVGEDVADDNDIILEVSPGVGGQEAMLFTAEIFNMYLNYARYKNWSVGVISSDGNELGGSRKASVEVGGEDVYKHLKHEAGVHRVQRVPKTEKQGRTHTSTITVSVLPQPKEIDIQIDPKDLKVETMRGSGPGGQSVNTTDSAVRITHVPTGTVAECRQERSQIKNKELALKSLKSRMYQEKLERMDQQRRSVRKMQMGTRGRSEKIRTYNFQQDRISDHRIKENFFNMQEFLNGEESLDDMISSLELESKYQMLDSMLDEYELNLKKSKKS